MKGTIKTLKEQGFGFIAVEGKDDLFFHATEVAEGTEFNDFTEGQEVEFTEAEGKNGKMQAVEVKAA